MFADLAIITADSAGLPFLRGVSPPAMPLLVESPQDRMKLESCDLHPWSLTVFLKSSPIMSWAAHISIYSFQPAQPLLSALKLCARKGLPS